MADMTIKDFPDNTSIDGANDYFLGEQNSTGDYRRYTRNSIMGVTGQPADISSVQTFTNKTLTTPVITSIYQDAGKTKLMTLPNTTSDTLVATNATQTLTNKSLTSPTITAPTVTGGMSVAGTLAAANNATIGGTLAVTGVLTPSAGLSANSVTNAALAAESVSNSKLSTTAGDIGGVWKSFSPNFVGWVIGTGGSASTTGLYRINGTTCEFRAYSTLGTSGQSVGTIDLSLPVTAKSTYLPFSIIGECRGKNNSGVISPLLLCTSNSTSASILAINTAGTYAVHANCSSTVPFTWDAGSSIYIQGFYEIA